MVPATPAAGFAAGWQKRSPTRPQPEEILGIHKTIKSNKKANLILTPAEIPKVNNAKSKANKKTSSDKKISKLKFTD